LKKQQRQTEKSLDGSMPAAESAVVRRKQREKTLQPKEKFGDRKKLFNGRTDWV